MSIDQDILQQLMVSFREELSERVAAINAGLLALEQGPAPEQQGMVIEELFRHVHSLKGAARAVELDSIEKLTHGMEDVFGAAKRGTIQLTAPLFDLLYRGVDLVGTIMAGVESSAGMDPEIDVPDYLVRLAATWRGQPIEPPQVKTQQVPSLPRQQTSSQIKPAIQPLSGETIRVPTARLDELMAQTGELLVARLRTAQQVEELQEMHALLARCQADMQQVHSKAPQFLRQKKSGSELFTLLAHSRENLHTLSDRMERHLRRVSNDASRLSLITDELQEGVKQARMLPLSTLVGSFRRLVRDLAREKGVGVTLEVRGADTEMDKHVLEQLQDPLMHLLRNSIDHGIEPPEERAELGKLQRGTISLSAERLGNTIIVEVADDGRGIDNDAVRQAAIRRGFLNEGDVAGMNDDQISALIFSPGLSTSPMITAVSGRGIGLDVVRKNVESLQGRVEVHSRSGQGATFALTLPLTLVSTHCLLVRTAGQTYALPLSAVERIEAVGRDDITLVEGKQAIRYQDRPLSLVRLGDVLRLSHRGRPLNGNKLPAVILATEGRRIAFLVDELLDEQEVVVKNLGKPLVRVPNVAGATVLGTGEIVFILNVADLVKSAPGIGRQPMPLAEQVAPAEQCKRILVVDDSITTRTLEKNILTTAGYEVQLATDGQEALALLMDNDYDLVVSDIDMPRMDGFELTQRVKQDPHYRDLPVILVTSLESPEHKARGIEVGADAYIVKSSFDQDSLLETIRQLI